MNIQDWFPLGLTGLIFLQFKGLASVFGRNDAKAETPVIWPPHVKSWLIGRDSDAGRDWGQEEKGMTEDEMAGWHHWLDGCESEWTPGDGDRQKPGMLQSMGSRRVRHDWATELNWGGRCCYYPHFKDVKIEAHNFSLLINSCVEIQTMAPWFQRPALNHYG